MLANSDRETSAWNELQHISAIYLLTEVGMLEMIQVPA